MSGKRYLKKTALQDALSALLERSGGMAPSKAERVPVAEAAGRICAELVTAKLSSPAFDVSAMDGVAVVASSVVEASEVRPIKLRVPDQTAFVDTGNPIPDGFDAVVMVEYIVALDDSQVEIMASAVPRQHIRRAGEDIAVGDPIVAAGERITPYVQGLLLAGGQVSVPVRKKPVVYIVPTGGELVKPGKPVHKGQLIEYNSVVLSGLVREWGGEPVALDPVPDDESALTAAVKDALAKCDVLVINGGSSAGRGDIVPDVISKMGELIVHGVNIMPGKPLAIGFVDGKPVLGVPGYPVSAIVVFEQFVKPLMAMLLGERCPARRRVTARVRRKMPGKLGTEEFVRVRLACIRGEMVASPMKHGAGQISSIAHADGILRIPAQKEGVAEDETVEVELLRDEDVIRSSIVGCGSYDPLLGIIDGLLRKRRDWSRLAFTPTGGVAALAALARGECHLAACHLLDAETGEYNIPFVKRYLGDDGAAVVKVASREIGLIVPKGNPHGLRSIGDLTRDDVRFVNRQAGSDMRAFTDAKLSAASVAPEKVNGYYHEALSEAQAAEAILSGTSNVAIGTRQSADSLGLDFVPLDRDQYDLIIPHDLLESDRVRELLEILQSAELKEAAGKLPGYDLSHAGELIGSA
jgi:putative molybdopterin biosynthesis protein